MPIRRVSLRIVLVLLLNDEKLISVPNPIPMELNIWAVAFTQV